ncbi:hypothetical protein [Streptomyces sp. SID13031]|uniref:hypothetical protein n=1 Tax=Streptomyces sp. SID13031 TaxID=2706046 RepID=UPI001941EFE8|nr:hypothetical protein [Streptomyces sp. SID13031]
MNDTRDFEIGKRLSNLPALREIGFSANRRLLGVQRLSHDPARGAEVFHTVNDPVATSNGKRVAGLRFADPRAHALLGALLVFRYCPTVSATATCANSPHHYSVNNPNRYPPAR